MDKNRFCAITCRPPVFVLLFILLLWEVPKAKGNCIFIESQNHCVCSLLSQSERLLSSFLRCLSATTYELRGGNLEQFSTTMTVVEMMDISELLVRKLIFADLIVPEDLFPSAVQFVSFVPKISELEFVNCTFLKADPGITIRNWDLRVSSLRFHQVTAEPVSDRLDLLSLNGWLRNLENLTITESQLTSIPCKIGRMFTALHFLDVSGNHFQDLSINSSFCPEAYPQLQVLKLQHNNLTSYDTICEALAHLNVLSHLDLSKNNLPERFSSSCTWPPSLHILNMSNTGLEHVDSALPPNIEILDLSANNIITFDLSLSNLKELYLSNNRLQAFPSVNQLLKLEVLSLEQNQISQLPNGLKHLQSLKAGHNFYNCSCSHHIEIIQDLATKESLLPDWPQDYVCKSPPEYHDFLIKDVPLSQCNKGLATHEWLSCTMVILLTSYFHLFFCLFFV